MLTLFITRVVVVSGQSNSKFIEGFVDNSVQQLEMALQVKAPLIFYTNPLKNI